MILPLYLRALYGWLAWKARKEYDRALDRQRRVG